MCIFSDCADPTTKGVWWRDDNQWCLYSAAHQALIRQGVANNLSRIDLGTIVSTVHQKGARYVVNLQNMEQEAVSSGQKRPIKVVDVVSTGMVQQNSPSQPTLVSGRPAGRTLNLNLHYRDSGGNLQRYDRDIESQLLALMASGSQRTLLVPDGRSGYYLFDLEAMEQRFVSRFVNGEPVLSDKAAYEIIAEVPWDAATTMMASIAAKAEKTLRRKVLVMVVDKFRNNENLHALFSEKAAPREVVTTRISMCSTEIYEKFVDSLEEVLQRFSNDKMGDVIRAAGKDDYRGMPLQIAFKPAERGPGSTSNASRTAVNPKALWISMAAPVAAAQAVVYGAVQLEILAYMLIYPASVCKERARTVSESCSGYVELERPEHGLPLAQVSVR